MSKHTEARTRETAALLGRPVQIAASFVGSHSTLANQGGLLGAVAKQRSQNKAVPKGTRVMTLPQNVVVAVAEDGVHLFRPTVYRARPKGTPFAFLPRGRFITAVRATKNFIRVTIQREDGVVILVMTGRRLATADNQQVVQAVLDASYATQGELAVVVADDAPEPEQQAWAVGAMPTGYKPGAAVAADPAAVAAAPAAAAPATAVAEPVAFDQLVVDHGLFDLLDEVRALALPAVRLVPHGPAPADRGTTRAGGWPDLPGSDVWPLAADGEPLAFLLQVDLAQLDLDVALPGHGLLSVFADARGGAPVGVLSDPGPLKRLRAAGIKDGVVAPSLPEGGSYPASGLAVVPVQTLPETLAAQLQLADEEVYDLLAAVEGAAPLHRVGGHPREAESVAAQAAREATGRRKVADFTYVAQVDLGAHGLGFLLADAKTGQLVGVVQDAG